MSSPQESAPAGYAAKTGPKRAEGGAGAYREYPLYRYVRI